MLKRIKTNKRKGFTLIELIVVMAVLAVLVLLAAPKFLGHAKEAQFTKHINNAKVLEDASERYYIDHGKWPRGADEDKYTPAEVSAYADKIYDITGSELELAEGDYWDIDYDALSAYAKLPDVSERANYVLRNPVGKVFYLDGLTEAGAGRVPTLNRNEDEATADANSLPYEEWVETLEAQGYVMATDADFKRVNNQYAPSGYYWRYIGTDEYIIIPLIVNGKTLTDYYQMFDEGSSLTVKGVASKNDIVADMSWMFYKSPSKKLDVKYLNTSSVTNMNAMFYNLAAEYLDLSSFDTSNVMDMSAMFIGSRIDILDLRNFDTSNVTNMQTMFRNAKSSELLLNGFDTSNIKNMSFMFAGTSASIIDLSTFDVSNVLDMESMFDGASAKTGYARTQTDADKLNASSSKPSTLNFTVKP